jgi:chromosome segregation ATPase
VREFEAKCDARCDDERMLDHQIAELTSQRDAHEATIEALYSEAEDRKVENEELAEKVAGSKGQCEELMDEPADERARDEAAKEKVEKDQRAVNCDS